MDYLRWILLAAGIFFVLIIYFVGRKSRQQSNIYDYEKEDDLPEFSADDKVDDWQDSDDEISEARIVAREEDDYDSYEEELPLPDEIESDIEDAAAEQGSDNKDVIVLYILAKSSDLLPGDKVNSAAQANGMKFGDMNIFHCIDNGRSVFSMANMMEPGIFDPDTMHELETPGLTLFMQKSASNNIDVFEGMLSCAYRMSEMLGAQLCNRHRQPLTQSDTEQYRELATGFDG